MLFNWFNRTNLIGIDLGNSNIRVYIKGKGIVLDEQIVISAEKKTKKLVEYGNNAKDMIGRNPSNIIVVKPMKNGVIANYTEMEAMMAKIFIDLSKKYNLKKPKVVVSVPAEITEVEERAVVGIMLNAGAKEVNLIPEPIAAAIGAKINIKEASGNIIVDIGGGTTEIAVISLGGMVVKKSSTVGGENLTESIINYLKRTNNVLIGDILAEEIKKELGCAYPLSEEISKKISGLNIKTGMPEEITITSNDIGIAMANLLGELMEDIKDCLEQTPPELISDIMKNGIVVSGGGAKIKNIDRLISEETSMPVYIAEDPDYCTVKGLITNE